MSTKRERRQQNKRSKASFISMLLSKLPSATPPKRAQTNPGVPLAYKLAIVIELHKDNNIRTSQAKTHAGHIITYRGFLNQLPNVLSCSYDVSYMISEE